MYSKEFGKYQQNNSCCNYTCQLVYTTTFSSPLSSVVVAIVTVICVKFKNPCIITVKQCDMYITCYFVMYMHVSALQYKVSTKNITYIV